MSGAGARTRQTGDFAAAHAASSAEQVSHDVFQKEN